MSFFHEISKLSELTPETLNSFISENKEPNILLRTANKITKGVSDRIISKEVALQFVFEELDAARQGCEEAVSFVKYSGFYLSEYEGALKRSFREVDGPYGPQQFLHSSIKQCFSDEDLMIATTLEVVRNIIIEWQLSTKNKERVDSSLQLLKEILEDDEGVMPALTSNIPAPAIAKERLIIRREKNICSAKEIISTLMKLTDDDSDAIIKKSLKTCSYTAEVISNN